MKNEHRFVFDVNVIVSALLTPTGTARRALDKAQDESVVVVSAAVAAELQDVLNREKFNRYVPQAKRDDFYRRFLETSTLISPTETIEACRDPSDNKYLELAVAANASAIVSGDPDLLALNPFRNIPVLSPNEFLDADFS
ncbi:MAG: putative toxin-antitoxin system toxin component, PIN family [Chloroherpetonaceae bacterium]